MKKKKLKSSKYSKRKKDGYVGVTIMLPPMLIMWIDAQALVGDIPRAAYIRRLIRRDMGLHEPS